MGILAGEGDKDKWGQRMGGGRTGGRGHLRALSILVLSPQGNHEGSPHGRGCDIGGHLVVGIEFGFLDFATGHFLPKPTAQTASLAKNANKLARLYWCHSEPTSPLLSLQTQVTTYLCEACHKLSSKGFLRPSVGQPAYAVQIIRVISHKYNLVYRVFFIANG